MSVPCRLLSDKNWTDRQRLTWKHFEALDYLTTSSLHGDPVVADQERKHDEGNKLAGVGLQGAAAKQQQKGGN